MSANYFDRSGQPIGDEAGRALFSDPDGRRVALTSVGDADVSTVHLVLDHGYGLGGPPLIFETMVFGGERDDLCWRYATEAQARDGHDRVVRALRRGDDPEEA